MDQSDLTPSVNPPPPEPLRARATRLWHAGKARIRAAGAGQLAAIALMIASIAVGLAVAFFAGGETAWPGTATATLPAPSTLPASPPIPLPALASPTGGAPFTRAIDSHTDGAGGVRLDVVTYVVQEGDYLFGIAEKFDIKPETILWSNFDVLQDNPDFVAPGMVLNILPVNGLYYQWQEGDRLDVIASSFKVDPLDIILWPGNGLEPGIDVQNPGIPAGTWLVVPGGRREFKRWEIPVLRRTDGSKWSVGGAGSCQGPFYSGPVGHGFWLWPTSSHWLSGTHYTDYHHAIDIWVKLGEPIKAAEAGVAVYAGWNTWGYGNLVVIDHGDGWQTVYAHLDAPYVYCGQDVHRGDIIGTGGSTGNSTGPHLHFEMIFNGVRVNPLEYLPG